MKKILVIDDDARMLKLINSYLQGGYEVYLIKSGPMAITFLQENIPDVILLDYMMPAYDGIETLKKIRSIAGCENLPIIMLTGTTEREVVKGCNDYGVAGYLYKPISKYELMDELDKILNNRSE